MVVGIGQLQEFFTQATEFDTNPTASVDMAKFEQNLRGIHDDFRNMDRNLLPEMDSFLYDLVLSTDFSKPGLTSISTHFLVLLFENLANKDRGHRTALDLSLEKRESSSIDGIFLYKEFIPLLFSPKLAQLDEKLRDFYLQQVAGFLEDQAPGDHWTDDEPILQAGDYSPEIVLLELARRRQHYRNIPNLSITAHKLENRLREKGIFQAMADSHPVLNHYLREWNYLPVQETWFGRLRKLSLDVLAWRPRKMSRWRTLLFWEIGTIVALVCLVVVVLYQCHNFREASVTQLLEIYNNIGS